MWGFFYFRRLEKSLYSRSLFIVKNLWPPRIAPHFLGLISQQSQTADEIETSLSFRYSRNDVDGFVSLLVVR
jgi:hypothetical protein